MAFLPYHLHKFVYPSYFDPDFGYELSQNKMHRHFNNAAFPSPFLRSPSTQTTDPNKFEICLDVHLFAPDELNVKTVGRQIVVEGKHEEKEDAHGYIYRHFVRKYTVPEGHEPNEVFSKLSSDGVLTITAPRDPIILPDKNERIVPIMQTGSHREFRELSVEHLRDNVSKVNISPKPEIVPILAIKYI